MDGTKKAQMSGARFEKENNLEDYFILRHGFEYDDGDDYGLWILDPNKDLDEVALLLKKCEIYAFLKEKHGIVKESRISRRIEPDGAVIVGNTMYIIEMKYENRVGRSQESLLGYCDFMKKEYERLVKGTDLKIKYCFLLNDIFDNDRNKDMLDYVKSVGCDYFFDEIPLSYFGL